LEAELIFSVYLEPLPGRAVHAGLVALACGNHRDENFLRIYTVHQTTAQAE
jgi:hypothetical protein